MAIDGTSSNFPVGLDAWGEEFSNDNCQALTAAIWNRIQHATYALEKHTANVLQTGLVGVLTHTTSGGSRPALLMKTYTIELTGSPTAIKTVSLSGFTANEKDLFSGTPLASSNVIELALRRLPGVPLTTRSFHCALITPIADLSGDSGWWIACASMKHDDSDVTIPSGEYCVSLMITR